MEEPKRAFFVTFLKSKFKIKDTQISFPNNFYHEIAAPIRVSHPKE